MPSDVPVTKRTLIGIAAPVGQPKAPATSDAPPAKTSDAPTQAKTSDAPGTASGRPASTPEPLPPGTPIVPKRGESLSDTQPDPPTRPKDSTKPSPGARRSSAPPRSSLEPPPRVASIGAGSEAPIAKEPRLLPILLVAAVGVLAVWFAMRGRGGVQAMDPPATVTPAADEPKPEPAPAAALPAATDTKPEPAAPEASASAAPADSAPAASASADAVADAPEPEASAATAASAAPAQSAAAPEQAPPEPEPPTPTGDVRVVVVTITPPDARLYRRGKLVGKSPVRIELPPGEKRAYEVGRPGYRTRKLVVDGSVSEISIGLRPDSE